MGQAAAICLGVLYHLASLATLVCLLIGSNWTWWNWILLIPLNLFLAEIWPIYWLLEWLTN